ncbi:piggyBac transposable element-derived protein 3-like [Rhopalosiphum padi]|uniref:piggyBac transposable element-derived protein 3-like n=1 Tax=Rhopalosiphum padi TaxID=40932 RepID=UPI00298DF5B3|nr:piggyBac transposable element-derived protein 3-like [Rhopalosiphum padi]
MSNLKDFEISELLDGNNSDCPYFDSDEDDNKSSSNRNEGHFLIEEFEDLMADLEKQSFNNDLDYEYLNTDDAANFLEEYNDYMPAIINTESLNDNLVNIQLSSKHEIKWERLPFSNSKKPILNDILPDVSDYYEIQAPLVYFNRYFNDAEIEKMAEMTNRYAIQNGSSWNKPTDIWEIKTFIALHIRMGCLKYPRVRMYWDTTLGLSNFSQYMTVNRFFSLRTNFHVVDNLTLSNDNKDRFKKFRPMYDCVRKRCKQLIVERNISIDEQIVPFTGKLNIKQYCKGKPNPWGVKIYVMCGSSGTIYDFLLYQGSATEFDIPPQIQKQVGMGGSVVLTLTQDLEKNKHLTKSRGRPSSSTPKNSPQTKKKKKEPLPHEETRKDLIGHLPMYNNNKLRCKKEGCGAKTHVYCKKYNIPRSNVSNLRDMDKNNSDDGDVSEKLLATSEVNTDLPLINNQEINLLTRYENIENSDNRSEFLENISIINN